MTLDIPVLAYEQWLIEVFTNGERDFDAEYELYNKIIASGAAMAHDPNRKRG